MSEARAAVHGHRALPGLRRQAAAPGGAGGDLRRAHDRRARRAAADRAGGALRPTASSPTRAAYRPPRRASAPRWRGASPRDLVRAHRRAPRPRPRLPALDRAHAHAVPRRAAAAAARDPGALEPVRRRLRARRAVGRPAPGRHRGAARVLDQLKAARQLAVRRRARPGRGAPRRLDRGRRARRRRARRRGALQRPGRRAGRRRRTRSPARYLFGDRAAAAARRRAAPVGHGWRCAASRAQPARPRRRLPARRVHRGHRRLRLGQVEPGQPGARRTSSAPAGRGPTVPRNRGPEADADESEPRRRPRSRREHRRDGRRHGADRAAGRGRPEADRPHAALEPRHLHRPVRRRAQALRGDRRGAARAATTPGRFSFNVAGGRCETCQGEGFVIVELLFLPSIYAPCPTCHGARYNPKTLEVTLPRAEHRRGAGDDGRRGRRVLRRRAGGGAQPARRCATSGWATCGSASRPPSCPAARPSASSSPPSCSAPAAATRSTCSTSPPPACTPPTSSC